jgi:DNA helicase HerA-like ATPase
VLAVEGFLLDDPRHTAVLGTTGSGKSVFAKALARAWPGPVLTIDPEDDQKDGGWPGIRVPETATVDDVLYTLRQGEDLYWVPHVKPAAARPVLHALVEGFMARNWPHLLVVVDEVELYAPNKGESPLCDIALRGRKRDVRGLWVSPRPAEIHHTLLSQARQIIFSTNFEGPYFQRYNLPADEITARLTEKFQYVVWQDAKLFGPYKEAL